MDKRLATEFVPGIAFVIGNAIGGLFLGAGLGAVATVIAILLRWRWDRSLPWMAIAIFALTLVLLVAAVVLDDATFIKLSATIGSLAFAAIVGVGLALRPSLLQRTLGYKLQIKEGGWRVLHLDWIAVSLARAAANEIVWRNATDDAWAVYNGLSDFLWFGLAYAVTWWVAHRYWEEPAESRAA